MEEFELIVNPSSGSYGAQGITTGYFEISIPGAEIDSFDVICPDLEVSISGNGFVLTLPENTTTEEKAYIAIINAVPGGGTTLETTVPIKQAATSLNIDKTDYTVNGAAQTLTIKGTGSNNLTGAVTFNPTVDWITNTTLSVDSQGIATISFDISQYSGLDTREGKIAVSVIKNKQSIINFDINITQEVETEVFPIYKNYIYSEDTVETFIEYHLNYDGEIIYAGKAYKYPGSETIAFLLNEVTSNYLSNGIVFEEQTSVIPDYLKTFIIKTSTDSERAVTFFNDWSYKDRDLTKGSMLSDPITGLVDSRQYLISSWILPTSVGTVYRSTANSKTDISLNYGINGYNYLEDLSKKVIECGSYINIGFEDDYIKYVIDNTDKDYVLYYTNAAGGWDSLLVEGNAKKTDNIKSETFTQKRLNVQEFDKTKYLNTMTASWVLYTGYLTDEQASKMFNLIESNNVYLHNLKSNTIIPVLITDTNCEYKTYSNNGRSKFYYTINIEASQDTYRK